MVGAERVSTDCQCDALPVQAKRLGTILPVGHDDDGAILDPADEPRLMHRRVVPRIPSIRHRSLPGTKGRRCSKSTVSRP